MKKLLVLLAAGLMVGLIINGCVEDPWEPDPGRPIDVFMVSAPDTTTEVPGFSTVNFVWSANGGNGNITYEWYLSPGEDAYGSSSSLTSIAYENVGSDSADISYTFHVRATDEDGDSDEATAEFMVSMYEPPPADTDAPAVTITMSPAEGSYAATGSDLTFAWEGDDGNENDDMLMYQYAYPTSSDTSAWVEATNVTFSNVVAADPAIFFVRAKDLANNMSDWASVSFTVRNATILYIDDYLFLDALGDVDRAKERDQKQFYRNALDGYAFAEWDIFLQDIPDTADLVDAGVPVYSTVILASDSEIGSTDGTPWYWLGDPDLGKGYSARYFLEQGGNFMLCGALALLDMTQAYPPAVMEGDFEFDWLGIDSTEWSFDYWYEFTWAVKDPATSLDLPDSMKIDVAKNGDQDDYAIETPGLRNEATVTTEVIYTWGLWVDGSEPSAFGHPVGHIVRWDGTARTAMLNFDVYSMPPEGIQQTFQAILTEFGE